MEIFLWNLLNDVTKEGSQGIPAHIAVELSCFHHFALFGTVQDHLSNNFLTITVVNFYENSSWYNTGTTVTSQKKKRVWVDEGID